MLSIAIYNIQSSITCKIGVFFCISIDNFKITEYNKRNSLPQETFWYIAKISNHVKIIPLHYEVKRVRDSLELSLTLFIIILLVIQQSYLLDALSVLEALP